MDTEIRLDGQVAVVTGAGHGLGRSYALALASRGAAVVCNDLLGDAADATAQRIADQGGRACAESSSVATPEGGEAIVAAAIDAFGAIDIVVNNAGQLRNAAFDEMSAQDFRDVLDTHLFGSFHVTQPAFRHMRSAGYGRIVFTSSAATWGFPWQVNYAAAKAGILGLCNTVALEGEQFGIKANAIMPMALTGMGERGRPDYSPEDGRDLADALGPLAANMKVENVAPFVVYLASRRCAYNHVVFSVGCGHVARVFLGATRGWYAPGLAGYTPEDVEANLDTVTDLTEFGVPESMSDESRYISRNLPAG
jgi:NAD(P)-dependent dehydrogenase (short-subunit alcohol dehydrogenase family)